MLMENKKLLGLVIIMMFSFYFTIISLLVNVWGGERGCNSYYSSCGGCGGCSAGSCAISCPSRWWCGVERRKE